MKLTLVILALLVGAFAHETNESDCTFTDNEGRLYDLSPLRLLPGEEAYHFVWPKSTSGDHIFNVCGDLKGLDFGSKTVSASVTNAVVLRETSPNTFENAGQRAEWADLSAKQMEGVEIVYGEGAPCGNSQRKTSFEFLCDQSIDQPLLVTDFQEVDSCYEIIRVSSKHACAVEEQEEQEEEVSVIPFPFILIFSLCCLCCGAIYAVKRRRNHQRIRRQNRENQMIQFSNVAFQQIPMQEFPEPPRSQPQAPQMSPATSRTQMPGMQFLQAPQYFVYPSVMQPAILESDEEIARKLQADFDREL